MLERGGIVTREKAIEELTELLPEEFLSEYSEALDMAIKALGQQSTDAVDRQRVLEIIEREEFKGDALFEIKMLAPVTPPPKIGYWEKDEYGNIHCTFCGCNAMYDKILYKDDYFGKVIRVTTDYCPTCGAKMKGMKNNVE